jgi:micrococcal nuclease
MGTGGLTLATDSSWTPTDNQFVYSRAYLVRIVDGDTIIVDLDLGMETWKHNVWLRLYGINSPESRGKSRVEGKAATANLDGLITAYRLDDSGDRPRLLIETHSDKKGGFGRWLATLWGKADGVWIDLCQTMIDDGHAVPYRR